MVGCWFGEGATSEGDWHEGLNFAGIHQLPVIFVCENNYYAISVGQPLQMAIDNVADRAAGYGFPGVVVDGNDVLACFAAMKTAVRTRAGRRGPDADRGKTYRFFPHTSDDDDRVLPLARRGPGGQGPGPDHAVRRVRSRTSACWMTPRSTRCGPRSRPTSTTQIDAAWDAADPDPSTPRAGTCSSERDGE